MLTFGVRSRTALLLVFIPFVLSSGPVARAATATGGITIAWDANGEEDLAGYVVSWGTAAGEYATSTDVGNVTEFTIPDLVAGMRYFVAVQAYSTSGLTSPYSTELPVDVPTTTPGGPTVTAVSPASGSGLGGTIITLTGTGFSAPAAVNVGGILAYNVTVVSSTTITAVTPAHAAGRVNVLVTFQHGVQAGLADAFGFVADGLTIQSVSPATGSIDGGTSITIKGSRFMSTSAVTFGTTAAMAVTFVDSETIVAVSPAHAAGLVDVVVSNGGTSARRASGFAFLSGGASTDSDIDGLPDLWELQFGLNPWMGTGADGATGDPDGDGVSNQREYAAGTHPRGTFRRHFAEGVSSVFFTTTFALANGGSDPARVLLSFQLPDGTVVRHALHVAPQARATLDARDVPAIANLAFSTTVEADTEVLVDRTMFWDASGYGAHAETGVTAAAPTWYLAEGATHSGLDLFYLIQNPGSTAATIEIRYLLPAGAPVVKSYVVSPFSRANIWVDLEDPRLRETDVSAVVTSTNGVPIIVERSLYLASRGQAFAAGHNSAGVTAPSTTWFLAEGATGAYFDMFVLIANPTASAATVTGTYLLPSGATVEKTYVVGPTSRFNIWVDLEDARLADTAVSASFVSTNNVPIVVERTMWWPGTSGGGWQEGHNAFGTTEAGSRWGVADGEVGGLRNTATYYLVANTSATPTTVRVTLLFEEGASSVREFPVAAHSRFNVDVATEFPDAAERRFGAVIESVGLVPASLVVERSMFWDAGGVSWAAGTDAVAMRMTNLAASNVEIPW